MNHRSEWPVEFFSRFDDCGNKAQFYSFTLLTTHIIILLHTIIFYEKDKKIRYKTVSTKNGTIYYFDENISDTNSKEHIFCPSQ